MIELPELMVAPNGARRKKADHPALPVTIPEIVETAMACHAAGADGLHAHVRDAEQDHVLDAGLYRELLQELSRQVPQMAVQITTEAVGRYTPAEQRVLVEQVQPRAVSVALGEMTAEIETERSAVRDFYHGQMEAGVAVQHILYHPAEIDLLGGFIAEGVIPNARAQVLFVLGRYSSGQQSRPEDLNGFVQKLHGDTLNADWAVCAFGYQETQCLVAAYQAGGKMRAGFENSIWNADGSVARDNAQRVTEIVAATKEPSL